MSRADGPAGVLLIHGLGGTEFDLGSLHKVFKRAGLETHSLMLPGHGGQPADLLSVTAEDWVQAVVAEYRQLKKRYGILHIVGMCMGALLAAELAKRERHAGGRLILLAPPVFLDGWATPWYRDVRHVLYRIPYMERRIRVVEGEPFGLKNELVRGIVRAKFERGDNFHYRWVPLAAVRQVDRLREWVKQGLEHVVAPTLIVHSHEDELTSVQSAYFLRDAMTRARVELVLLNNSYHMVCVDNDREWVARSILMHLDLDPDLARPAKRTRSAAFPPQQDQNGT